LGFVFAGAYLWLARPTFTSITFGAIVIVPGLLVRALASGHLEKNQALATGGPYAYTRNPLYFGSLVIAAGFTLAARSWWVLLIALAMFLSIYLPVISAEERFLQARFHEFQEYARRVPRLFPRPRPYRTRSNGFRWHLYWKHREYNAGLGALLLVLALVGKAVWVKG
jgi:protein-S-isoprenylcysteine O-methyltransferase Ste14